MQYFLPSFKKTILVISGISVLGIAYHFYGENTPQSEENNKIENVLPNKVGERVKSEQSAHQIIAPLNNNPDSQKDNSSEESNSRLEKEISDQQIVAPISREPLKMSEDVDVGLEKKIDMALNNPPTSQNNGAEHSAELSKEKQAISDDVAQQDFVVPKEFVKDFAHWICKNYHEPRAEGHQGYSTVLPSKANFRYSSSTKLRSGKKDFLKSRIAILQYVMKPGILEALYGIYAQSFLDELGQFSVSSQKDFYAVQATLFLKLANSLNAASKVDLDQFANNLAYAGKQEKIANRDFAKAYTNFDAAKSQKDEAGIAMEGSKMEESYHTANFHGSRYEQIRKNLAYSIRKHSEGEIFSLEEMSFLGEWLIRHRITVESIHKAADICFRMSQELQNRAN